MSLESPRSDEPLDSLLRLSMLPGIGPRTLAELLRNFDSADAVLNASEGQLLQISGVGPKLVHSIANADLHVDIDALFADCERLSIEIVTQASTQYPQRLLELDDAPPVLFMQGTIRIEDEFAVVIVGTRHPTAYGRRQTELISAGLARAGVTIVSGLARGIDGIAHRGDSRCWRSNHRRSGRRHGVDLSTGTQ